MSTNSRPNTLAHLETGVTAFKALPRHQLAPSGAVPNHWHFSVRHVPLSPPGNLLVLVNPPSQYIHVEGPFPTSFSSSVSASTAATPTPATHAALIAHLLLGAFVKGMSAPAGMVVGQPWSWSTTSAEWAEAVGNALREMGVEGELLNVGIAEGREKEVANECWHRFMGELVQRTAWS